MYKLSVKTWILSGIVIVGGLSLILGGIVRKEQAGTSILKRLRQARISSGLEK
jgi:Ca2+/H+ antiporter